ncbi:MAG: RNA polymerase factor sigma-54 [Gammaproteobacteria bacterium]|nr:MAG: RNA polymerase factor sigma-54 [Gammaproteobacteria bacterium]
MKPTLQLKIGQHLTMTPQLQQAIRLLQLSSLDLQSEVQEALESNPLLETDDSPETETGTTEKDTSDTAETTAAASDPSHEPVVDFSQNATTVDNSNDLQSQNNEDTSVDLSNQHDLPDDLPVDSNWDDVYQEASYTSSGPASSTADDDFDFESRNSEEETLYDQLMWQLNLTPMSQLDKAIAIAIIEAIDERGYLCASVEDIRESLLAQTEVIADLFRLQDEELQALGIDPKTVLAEESDTSQTDTKQSNADSQGNDADWHDISIDEVSAVLHRVQQFDPPGVAARNLRECLLIQLQQLAADTPYLEEAIKVVDTFIESLGSRDFNLIMRKGKLSESQLKEAIALIRTLNPHPGSSVDSGRTEYVVPDVIVYKHKNRWKVELNPAATPRLKVNQGYASLIQRADSSNDNTFLKNNLQEARWFIKSLMSRNETLLKVATRIVEYQIDFFEEGEEAMKPLVLHDIAEAVEMHESTISRVTTQKYMHTPRGIFELKYFFSSHVSTGSGGECSSTAIRAMIKKLIAGEEPKKPLSDSKIVKILEEQDIKVARRTIAKYREAMNIPPSNERKRLV